MIETAISHPITSVLHILKPQALLHIHHLGGQHTDNGLDRAALPLDGQSLLLELESQPERLGQVGPLALTEYSFGLSFNRVGQGPPQSVVRCHYMRHDLTNQRNSPGCYLPRERIAKPNTKKHT